jgi:outer membrane protein OmpA-like peptidoglycan-associated protein
MASKAYSQQKEFQWRIGFSGGFANYHGDLTPRKVDGSQNGKAIHHVFYFNENYASNPSFRVSLERQLSPSTGLSVHYGQYYFGMSDRYIERDGTLYTANPNFPRSLNFENRTRELGFSMVFRSDNDRLLPSEAIIAPYLTLGFGLMHFDVWGDLLDENGQKYDNTIIDIIHDGKYETSLPEWETERDGGYLQFTGNAQLGLGFRIKVSSNSEIFAQSNFMYTFTDFLDDVSGPYREEYTSSFQEYASKPGFNIVDPDLPFRGNPDGARDWIIYHGFGLRYNFGASKKNFRAPRLSTGYYPTAPEPMLVREPLVLEKIETPVANPSPATLQGIQPRQIWEEIQRLDTLKYENQILTWSQEIQKRENYITAGKLRERNLVQIQNQIERQHQTLINDKNLTAVEKEDFIRASDRSRFNIRYSIDSIRKKEREIVLEIDSIAKLKKEHRLQPTVLLVYTDSTAGSTFSILESTTATKTEAFAQPLQADGAPAESAPPSDDASPSAAGFGLPDDSDRIKNLEEQNKYLQSERDKLLAANTEKDKKSKQKPAKTTNSRRKSSSKETVVRQEPAPAPDENESRRRRRRRAAAAGVALGTVAVIASDNDNNNESQSEETSASRSGNGSLSQEEISRMAIAVSSVTGGIPIQQTQPKTETLRESPTVEQDQKPVRIRPLPENYFQPIETIYFDSNQRIPAKIETGKLKELADFVRSNQGYGLKLTGYTDNTGSLSYNLKLAEDRMANVADALEKEYGISKDLLRYESGGKVLRGNQKSNSPQDRKVEVSLILLDHKENED